MERLVSKEEMRVFMAGVRREPRVVGFVPTMGALHEGHLSLVRAARDRSDVVVVSVFVNPTQFGPSEDLARYPRDLEGDASLLDAEGVDVLFAPSEREMYGSAAQVTVDPGPLAMRWEGEARPGHFTGVATVVAKLLAIVRPDLAFFGEKDYQQLRVVEAVARDLDLGVEIVGCPEVRDADGLALSSRNVYLTPNERCAALSVSRGLRVAAAEAAAGERDAAALRDVISRSVEAEPLAALDYAAIVDPATLEPLESVTSEARALVAVRIGATRLIDNIAIVPGA